jgi:hypothetical protein
VVTVREERPGAWAVHDEPEQAQPTPNWSMTR